MAFDAEGASLAPGLIRLLLLSNGHGEDLSGALLGRRLMDQGIGVTALPLVGNGQAYDQMGIPIEGPTREFSTGGLGYTSLVGRLTELIQGQIFYVAGRLIRLWRQRQRYALIVAVGDVVPVIAAWLAFRPAVVYLVAYSSHYEGRLRLPWPCGPLLKDRRFLKVWSRDELTASDLQEQLGRQVEFLGNPFMDLVDRPGPLPLERSAQTLGLLPGSRLPEALRNLELMLRLLPLLPAPLRHPGRLELHAALVKGLQIDLIVPMARPLGWRLKQPGAEDCGKEQTQQVLVHGDLQLHLHWSAFARVLDQSDLLLSMTGTAAEQAVGLGKPVLQLAGQGPQFTPGFAEAQRRLLGPGVWCVPGPCGAAATLEASAGLAAELLTRLADPVQGPAWREDLARIGRQRIGTPGGSLRMAAAIMDLLRAPHRDRHG